MTVTGNVRPLGFHTTALFDFGQRFARLKIVEDAKSDRDVTPERMIERFQLFLGKIREEIRKQIDSRFCFLRVLLHRTNVSALPRTRKKRECAERGIFDALSYIGSGPEW